MDQQAFTLYQELEALSIQMLEAARSNDWSQVTALEQSCRAHMNRLRALNAPESMDKVQRRERLKILKHIVEIDGEIRKLAHPWTGRVEALLTGVSPGPTKPLHDPISLASFRVVNPIEIRSYLEKLHHENSLLTLFAMDNDDTFVVTQIIELDVDQSLIKFELASEDVHLQTILRQKQAYLVGFVDHVKFQIPLTAIEVRQNQDDMVLIAAFPDRLFRIQRREAFRVKPLDSAPAHCLMPVVSAPQGFLQLDVLDISVSGFSFETQLATLDLAVLDVLAACQLSVPGQASFTCDLRVRYLGKPDSLSGKRRVGVDFAKISGADERSIQVYVNAVDAHRRGVKPA